MRSACPRVFVVLLSAGFGLAGCGDDGRTFDDGETTARSDAAFSSSDGADAGASSSPSNVPVTATSSAGETGSSEATSATTGASSGNGSDTSTSEGPDASSTRDSRDGTSTSEDAETSTEGSSGSDSWAHTHSTEGSDSSGAHVTLELGSDGALVGFAARASATAVASDGSDVTLQWTIRSKPTNSQVTNADLVASEGQVEFFPDLAGDYVVRLNAQSASGAVAQHEVTVRAWAYDVGYLSVAGDQDSWTRAGFMVRSDGTAARQVGCFFSSTASSESEWLGGFRSEGQLALMPYLPKDPETPARIAYNHSGTSGVVDMYIAGPENDCDGALPLRVPGGSFPSFAPSGKRVSVMRTVTVATDDATTTTYSITTYGVDDGSVREVRSGATGSIYGATWVDESTLVWAETDSSVTRAYRVKDSNGAFGNDLLTDTILDCSTAAAPIRGIHHVVERGTSLFVGSAQYSLSSTSTYYVWRLERSSGGTYDCDETAPTTHLLTDNNAHDFDVAPDGSKLLYFAYFDAAGSDPSSSKLFLLDVTSQDPPVTLSGDPATVASGAHFAANGRQVIWTETRQVFSTYEGAQYERPQGSVVRVANADGTRPRTLVRVSSSDTQARMLHTGGNAFCSVGVNGSAGVFAGGLLAALLSLVSRRRRSARR